MSHVLCPQHVATCRRETCFSLGQVARAQRGLGQDLRETTAKVLAASWLYIARCRHRALVRIQWHRTYLRAHVPYEHATYTPTRTTRMRVASSTQGMGTPTQGMGTPVHAHAANTRGPRPHTQAQAHPSAPTSSASPAQTRPAAPRGRAHAPRAPPALALGRQQPPPGGPPVRTRARRPPPPASHRHIRR